MKLLIAYIFLVVGIFLGILANGYFLKMSEGFTRLLPSIACGIIILLTVFCLSRAMKSKPNVSSIDLQIKAGYKGAPWDGVRNYQAAKDFIITKKSNFKY